MSESSEARAFLDLVAVCRRLRGPDGCPWDREQTLSTMTPYLIEEAAETAEAVSLDDPAKIAEELGDLVFLGVFCLELLRDRPGPGIEQALRGAADKLIRRHPHVYGETKVEDGDQAYHQWQHLKRQEPGASQSLLGGQPPALAALVAAFRSQEKASAVGFDWPEASGPLAKVREEVEEVAREIPAPGAPASPAAAREIGDLLFAVVNLSRHLKIDPERELKAANRRFRERFEHIERRLAEQGRTFQGSTLEDLDRLWDEAKTTLAGKENR